MEFGGQTPPLHRGVVDVALGSAITMLSAVDVALHIGNRE